MIFLNVNNFSTTITQPLMPSSGTINVQSSAGLPSSIPAGTVIPLTLNDALTQLNCEIVYITAISGTTLTVSRGEENTAAQDWKVGDFAFSAMTAGSVIPTGGSVNLSAGVLTNLLTEQGGILAYPIASPVNATFTAGSGTLPPGTYYYQVTALTAVGETPPSPETSFTLTATGGVNVNWTAVPNATGYKIYGRSTTAEQSIGTVSGTTLTFLDNGSVTYPSQSPPVDNSTASIIVPDVLKLPAGSFSNQTGIIVPFYYYPNNAYSDPVLNKLLYTIARYPEVPFIVIINPASGPGTVTDENWGIVIDCLHAVGAKVVGYVNSADMTVPLATLESTINTWTSLYNHVDGIFVDNMDNTNVTADQNYYTAITEYCHSHNYPICIANPGTEVLAIYYGFADIVIGYETGSYPTAATLNQFFTGGSSIVVPPTKKGLIAYNVPFSIPDILNMQTNARWLYVTDGPSSNPYNGLPTYFDRLAGLLSRSTDAVGGLVVSPLATPAGITLSAGTGTLAAGTYYYRVTATSTTGETLPSAETSFALSASGGVNIAWTQVPGAVNYNIYGRSSGAELLISSVPNGTLFYLDSGSIVPSGAMPTANTSGNIIGGGLPILSGTTAAIGGGALAAGGTATGTVAIAGATTAMAVVVTPSAYPGNGVDWAGYVSSSGVVTVVITAIIAVTPTATTYNVRVIQ